MKIFLLKDVKKVGQRGALVEVADGYAQNVLIPKKLAVPATDSVLKRAKDEEKNKVEKQSALDASARTLLSNVDGKTVQIKARVTETGGLFESIREPAIISAVRDTLHVEIPEEYLVLPEPIKKAGNYELTVSGRGSKATLYVAVIGH